MYHHPQLDERLKDAGVIDRYVRTMGTTLEHVFSLQPTVSGEGLECVAITLDLVQDTGHNVASNLLGMYRMDALHQAVEDCLKLATRFGLGARRTTPTTGWDQIASPDGPVLIVPPQFEFKV
jgi:hypothetical protein